MKTRKLAYCLLLFFFVNDLAAQQQKPNILFIAIDDLKPVLGCYGDTQIKTPNIDRLAGMGTVFLNNYCQQAVCGPTRASLMTGKRPDYTQVWDLKTPMRDVNPDIISLPQYLITQGYSTQGIGKVYDPRNVDKEFDKPSWSVPYYKTAKRYYAAEYGEPVQGRYQLAATKELAAAYAKEAKEKGIAKPDINDYVLGRIKPAVEKADVPDNAYNDGANALQAKDILINLSQKKDPFFFAVGFSKPHLPFVAPAKYWDLYNREALPLASFQDMPSDGVSIAFHDAGEIRAYTDIPPLLSFTDQKDYGLTLPVEKQKELIHGYYAAVSYTDAQVGILLNILDSLGLTKNTIIVLWGDHGWHLGDHNLWCKHSNFEQAAHAPLIIAAPGIASGKTKAVTEFVDIFPTLCDLSGSPVPAFVDGKSLVQVMKQEKNSVKEFAASQYPRSGSKAESERLGYASSKYMGYSIRTERYRYTIWMGDNYKSWMPFDKKLLVATELYDYQKDPLETKNLENDKTYSTVSAMLYKKMLGFLATQQRNTKQ